MKVIPQYKVIGPYNYDRNISMVHYGYRKYGTHAKKNICAWEQQE